MRRARVLLLPALFWMFIHQGDTTVGTTPRPYSAVPQDEFALVIPTPGQTKAPPPIYEPRRTEMTALPQRPVVVTTPRVTSRTQLSPPPAPRDVAHSVRGGATWYCWPGHSVCPHGYSGGLYAAAGPALRAFLGAHWRGRVVTACSRTACVTVKLVDWCACGGGHVIDLFADAFRRLAPLSAGVVSVTVH